MIARLLGFTAILLGLASGCATLRDVDPSLLNHPAMNLHQSLAADRVTYLTTLGPVSQAARSGGACTTCAH